MKMKEYKLAFKDYNKALMKGKLLGLKCNNCGAYTCPPKITCQECTSMDLEIVQLSGEGKVVTFTVNNVAAEGRECEAPYTIIMVELNEGPWLMGNFADLDPGKITMEIIGKKVKLGVKVLPKDKYASLDKARPLFSFA
jgi:hypothetical protein